MSKRGRPPIKEAEMLAVWRLVQTEMHMAEHRNVCKACRAIMRRVGLIKFQKTEVDPETKRPVLHPLTRQPITSLTSEPIKEWKLLRKRYYQAETNRQDVIAFPILHHRALLLEQTLPEQCARQRALSEHYRAVKAQGYDPSVVVGVGAVPAAIQKEHELVLMVQPKSA